MYKNWLFFPLLSSLLKKEGTMKGDRSSQTDFCITEKLTTHGLRYKSINISLINQTHEGNVLFYRALLQMVHTDRRYTSCNVM